MVTNVLKKVFGSKSQRDVKRLIPYVVKINSIEAGYQKLTDEELVAKTQEFRDRFQAGETLDDLMCEAFAVVKNACRRLCGKIISVCGHEIIWDMIPFDVQLMGGIALHWGNVAEMATGEGKTLVATAPLYLNALSGKNCQLVTVSDYHARRDSEWMGSVYTFLGLTVGCIQNDMTPAERRTMYECDITYGTNSEFGFDYLRDMGMAVDKEQLVQRDHFFVIVDEADSILIDEARTPLIISGPAAVSSHQYDTFKPLVGDLYKRQNHLCSRLILEAKEVIANPASKAEEIDNAYVKLVQVKLGMPKHKQLMHLLEDGTLLKKLEKTESFIKSDQNRGMLQEVEAELYFSIDEKTHDASLTDKGRSAISPDDPDAFVMHDLLGGLHDIDNDSSLNESSKIKRKQEFQDKFSKDSERIHNISQLIKAYCLFEKDVNYVVKEGKVLIVDEHTGRLMPGRRFNEGLHQALEAKESVTIEGETQTFATITIQNYFRLYEKMAGMTGTAESEATEFHQIYKMDVIVIPTNCPCIRKDTNDKIYKTKREKYKAIIDEVVACHEKGQPVLLGTVSVDISEILSRMLKRRHIPHNVLNAKNHESEADIIARAGQPAGVTVATNMAGRGTDIKLGVSVPALGGLHVIGSERHDSRRIDRQLRGRCSRQGDPGSSIFYVSLEDNLMRLFGSDKIASVMGRLGLQEGEELQHPLLNKSISTAQKRVEQQHFAIRKRTLEFDDVMNKQREILYGFRKEVLVTDAPRNILFDIVAEEMELHVQNAFQNKDGETQGFNSAILLSWLNNTFPLGFMEKELYDENGTILEQSVMIEKLIARVKLSYDAKQSVDDDQATIRLERHIVLEAVDRLWQEHLYAMDHLRNGIFLRQYAQKDPLVEYKREAYEMFADVMTDMNQEILSNMFRSATSVEAFEKLFASLPQEFIHSQIAQFGLPGIPNQPPAKHHHQEHQIQFSQDGIPANSSNFEFSPDAPDFSAVEHQKMMSFKREEDKVGRNDECPCGSGRKYKKCCGK